jgi:monovalent cation/proton antiporter MnhG/PhaG subunit
MSEVIIQLFAFLGSMAVLLAALGMARFPDFFTRAHAATKASAFGIACLFVAVCVAFPYPVVIAKAVFSMIALFLTLPVASQALADAMRDREEEDREEKK